MARITDEIVLGFDINTDLVDEALGNIEQGYKKTFKKIEKAVARSEKGQMQAVGGFIAKMRGAMDVTKQMKVEYEKEQKEIMRLEARHAKWREKMERASSPRMKERWGKKMGELGGTIKKRYHGQKARQEQHADYKAGASKDLFKAAKEAGAEIAEPFSKLLNKDLPGAFESAARNTGAVWKKVFSGAGALIGKGGKKLWDKGGVATGMFGKAKEKWASGGVKGKVAGGGMAVLGTAVKGIGGLMKMVGPVISMFAKIGPVIGMLGSALVGLVKMFLDAESQAKDFQKSILQSASTTEYLSATQGDASMAAEDLQKDLKALRGAAMNFEMALDWGIDKEQFAGVINTLTQEGVALHSLSGVLETASKDTSAYSKDYKTMVQMIVGYSRNLGVSTQEVSSLQAEMMSEMGMGLSSVEKGFAAITRGAEEGGIAGNKFFNMIRSVSADISLFNFRMEDAAQMLGKLGTVMSPRNAQKFMQTAMGALKGMGRIEKIKTTLLAGPDTVGKIVKEDMARKERTIAAELARASGDPGRATEFQKAIAENNTVMIEEAIKKAAPEQQGALRETMSKLRMQKTRMGKGLVGTSLAAGQVSPVAQAEALTAALMSQTKGKKGRLSEAVGSIDMEMLAESQGVSEETVEQMAMLQDQVEEQRKVLIANAKTEEEKAKIRAASFQAVWDMIDADTQKQIMGTKESVDYAKQQTDLQVSIVDKLGMVVDVLMNYLYDALIGIWDFLVNAPVIGGDDKAKADMAMKRKMLKSGDEELKATSQATGGDVWAVRDKAIMGKVGSAIASALTGTTVEELTAKRDDAFARSTKGTPEERTAAANEFAKYDAQLKAGKATTTKAQQDQAKKAVNAQFGAAVKGDSGAVRSKLGATLAAAEKKYGIKQKMSTTTQMVAGTPMGPGATGGPQAITLPTNVSDQLAQAVASGVDLDKALADAGYSSDEIAKIMAESRWSLSPSSLVDLNDGFRKAAEEVAPPKPGTPAARAQIAATAAAPPGSAAATAAGAPPVGTIAAEIHAERTGTTQAAMESSGGMPTGPALGAKMVAAQTESLQAQLDSGETIYGTLGEIEKVLKVKGIKINPTFLDTKIEPMVEKATLASLRTALFEFAMLTGYEKMKSWKDDFAAGKVTAGEGAMKFAGEYAGKGKGATDTGLAPKAAGGYVARIGADGIAQVIRPAPGEGLTSIGVGERITPAGGGGGQQVTVRLELAGDAKRFIKAQAADAIAEHAAAAPRR